MKKTKMKTKSKGLVSLATLFLAATALGACQDSDDPSSPTADTWVVEDAGADTLDAHDVTDADTADFPGDTRDVESDTAADAETGACPTGPPSRTLQVATINTRLFFDTTCDSGDCGPGGFERAPSQSEYRERLEDLAAEIAPLDADILLFQEIETRSVLSDLSDELDARTEDYTALAFGERGFPASIDVGILARGNLVDSRGYRDETTLMHPDGSETMFVREFLRADLSIAGHPVTAFVAHFKSKANDDPGRRLAEARGARRIVEEVAAENPEALVLLGGDLNDTPGSPPLEALQSTGKTRLAGQDQSLEEIWSYCYLGEREAIDHLLWSSRCADHYVDTSALARGERMCPGDRQFADSDHAAVTAEFRVW
jgi:endonuclease/exonuclease/phosphatase family metal-dependent hydrolase